MTDPIKPANAMTPYYVMVRALSSWVVCARWKQVEDHEGAVTFVEIQAFSDAEHGDTHKSHTAATAYWSKLNAHQG